MARSNKVDITKIQSDSQYRIKIGLKAKKPTTVTVEAGTILFPDEPLAYNTQSLITRDDVSTAVSET